MKIQIRHVNCTIEAINDEPAAFLNRPESKPDQFWVLNNATGTEFYSIGKYVNHDNLPKSIAGIPLHVQERGGEYTYHGPGQVSFIILLNARRLLKETGDLDRPRMVVKMVGDIITKKFNQTIVYRDDDAGLYLESGAKVGSFGSLTDVYPWVAIKLSINLNVDLTKFSVIDVCGVANRPMANLLPGVDVTAALTAETGYNIVYALLDQLYAGQDMEIVPWTVT